MKKILLSVAIVMMFGFGANAQKDSFMTWSDADNEAYRYDDGQGGSFNLPGVHGDNNDNPVPVGSGLLVLTALGAGYAVMRKRK